MRAEEVGGHDSLSGEYGLMLTLKIWRPWGEMSNQKDRWSGLYSNVYAFNGVGIVCQIFMERGLEEVDCKYNQIEFSDLPGIDMECYMKMLCSGRPAFHFCCLN